MTMTTTMLEEQQQQQREQPPYFPPARRATNRERWLFQQAIEMSKTLGIPTPEIGFAYSKQQAREMSNSQRYSNWKACTVIKQGQHCKVVIMMKLYPGGKARTLKGLRRSMAHELIHIGWDKLNHGNSFENYYIDSLLKGHMLFDGRGIIGKIKRPDPSLDKQISQLLDRKKRLETRIKRTTTAIKKIDRKIKHLERRRREEK